MKLLRTRNLKPATRNLLGGADRDRTGGLLVANQALSQLSYSPFSSFKFRVSSFEQIVKLSAAHSKPET